MKNDVNNVIVFAGGTIGHIKPALVICKELNLLGYKVHFFSTKGKFEDYLIGNNYLENICFFDSPGYIRGIKNTFKNVKNVFVLIKTYKLIREEVKKINPIFVIGMGGSISTIGILASRGYKKVIHEQNAVIGFGNKIVKNKCNLLLSSYPLVGFIKIGNPIESIYKKSNLNKDKLLIVSGSNGSKTINDFFLNNCFNIINEYYLYLKSITIITGNTYFQNNIEIIEKINNDYTNNIEIIPFTNNIDKYLNNSYIVVSRGGAGFLSEIISKNIPSIIIPSPNVTDNHQFHNANYYEQKGCLKVLLEDNLNLENIKNYIDYIIKNYKELSQNMSENHNIYCKDLFISLTNDLINSEDDLN